MAVRSRRPPRPGPAPSNRRLYEQPGAGALRARDRRFEVAPGSAPRRHAQIGKGMWAMALRGRARIGAAPPGPAPSPGGPEAGPGRRARRRGCGPPFSRPPAVEKADRGRAGRRRLSRPAASSTSRVRGASRHGTRTLNGSRPSGRMRLGRAGADARGRGRPALDRMDRISALALAFSGVLCSRTGRAAPAGGAWRFGSGCPGRGRAGLGSPGRNGLPPVSVAPPGRPGRWVCLHGLRRCMAGDTLMRFSALAGGREVLQT